MGTTAMTFAVTLSAASDVPITVNYATQDGYFYGFYAATAGEDYQATRGTLTFAPGETTKPVTVLVNGDPRVGEYDESFYPTSPAQTRPSTTSLPPGPFSTTSRGSASILIRRASWKATRGRS